MRRCVRWTRWVGGTKMSGELLAGDQLLDALRSSNGIFREGSWDPNRVSGAGYELRMAGDLLVYPATPGDSEFAVIEEGTTEVPSITINPGDSALLSTVERFTNSFDITGVIGPKFRWAARGLLLLHGMIVHPGYGRQVDKDGNWSTKQNERLYLIVVNAGPRSIEIKRDEPIAYAQFFKIDPPLKPSPVSNIGFDWVKETL